MRKPLSFNEIRANLRAFAVEFKDDTSEHAEYATFWDELLRCFGVKRRRVATFQHVASRFSTNNRGFIDFFWPKIVIGEHKSLGKAGVDGIKAEEQALDYLVGGDIPDEDFPRYIISTDFANMRVTDLEAPDGQPSTVRFPITDIADYAETLGFLAGYREADLGSRDEAKASIDAAKIMGDLYAALTDDDDTDALDVVEPDDEEALTRDASIVLTRLLFLLFGDDSGLWEKDLFQRFIIERTSKDGSDLGAQLRSLFLVLDTPVRRRPKNLDETLAKFPYVNGEIFSSETNIGLLGFDSKMRDTLIRASYFDWRAVSPAVFGSLFQTVKSKQARRADGEHYTTEKNILKVLNPLFLDDYRARVRAARNSVRDLRSIQEELACNVYLDPACGCGNFLVVAYRELRAIELDIIVRLRKLRKEITVGETGLEAQAALDLTLGLRVSLDQFHGFEINWWPAKIAETVMFLVDHQANHEMAQALGQAPERLPINISAHIHHLNALDPEWADIVPHEKTASVKVGRANPFEVKGRTFVFGNPPFLGDNTRGKEQNAELKCAWGGNKTISRLDYVTAWHAKTLTFFDTGRHGEWAFVTTSSITQGDQAARLFEEIFGKWWKIKFAHRTFAWTSEASNAAAVHCVIVGFTRDISQRPRLFEYPDIQGEPQEIAVTNQINAYLVDGPNVLVEKRRKPLSSLIKKSEYGSKPTDDGNLIVEPDEYGEVMADPIAAKYVHPYVGARELLHNQDRWCLWLDGMGPEDMNKSSILRNRVNAVREFRAKSTAASTRNYPHHHLFRQLAKQEAPYVCVPIHVSETRRYFTVARFGPGIIASNANFQIPDADGFQFAMISSSMFITWQKTIGGRLKSDLRFASTLTWYTFPVPEMDDDMRQAIIAAGQGVRDARDLHPERSLADHYNPLAMAPELVHAHDKLDRLVDKAMGLDVRQPTEADRQTILFANYTRMSG